MHILITGCGRGIGYETALELSGRSGIKVLALSRSETSLLRLQQEALARNKSAQVIPLLFDLEQGSLQSLFALIREKTGRVDVLINNAAMALVKPFEQLSEQDFEQVYKVNVFRPAMLIRALIPLMESPPEKRTHIVNISSIGGFQGSVKFPGLSAYSSSKAAICSLTECLAVELNEKNISINALCLGAVNTEMLKQAFPGYQAPVNPDEMGRYIAWFARNGHHFQNGQVIPVTLSTP
ncbi:MAG TPA: SDR family oxidoreductase [Bacteroidia bacterium]|jgi:NAD(P)-dependent dehydrogenase (short-subunit alcohol dehydrogenase family)|nr:SDR family oxidoreductase [Bacteroidia bacterium]